MKTKKALTTQVIFFFLMSFIMIWIIVFGYQRITDVQDTLTTQQELEIKEELEKTFLFCKDPINSGSSKIIDLKGRPYNSICLNCQNLDPTSYPQEFLDEAQILADTGSNFLLLETSFSSSRELESYNILGELSLEDITLQDAFGWWDYENSFEQKIEIKCE